MSTQASTYEYLLKLANISSGETIEKSYTASSRSEAQEIATGEGWVLCEPRAKPTPSTFSMPPKSPSSVESAVFWGILKAFGVIFLLTVSLTLLYLLLAA